MKKEYINLNTGEVIDRYTLWGAKRYFKRDAKRFHYPYDKRAIVEHTLQLKREIAFPDFDFEIEKLDCK